MNPKMALNILKLSNQIPILGILGEQIVRNNLLEKGGDSVDMLAEYFLSNSDSEIREFGVEMVAKIDDPRVVEILCTVLEQDTDTGVQFDAAKALGKANDSRAIGALLNALSQNASVKQPWVVPERAAKTLGDMAQYVPETNNPEVITALIARLNSSYYQLSDQCYETLKLITGKSFGKTYDEWNTWYQENR